MSQLLQQVRKLTSSPRRFAAHLSRIATQVSRLDCTELHLCDNRLTLGRDAAASLGASLTEVLLHSKPVVVDLSNNNLVPVVTVVGYVCDVACIHL